MFPLPTNQKLPYYVVTFCSSLREPIDPYYQKVSKKIESLAKNQPGFLGLDSVTNNDNQTITLSYWENLEAIASWKEETTHQLAQKKGKDIWYRQYSLRIAKIEKQEFFDSDLLQLSKEDQIIQNMKTAIEKRKQNLDV